MESVILAPISLDPLIEKVLDSLIEKIRIVVKEELLTTQEQQLSEKLLSPAEACKLFQPAIHTTTLSRWTKDGIIQSIRLANKVYYKHSAILEAGKTIKRYQSNKSAI